MAKKDEVMVVDIVGQLQVGDKRIKGRVELPIKEARRLLAIGRAKKATIVPVNKVSPENSPAPARATTSKKEGGDS